MNAKLYTLKGCGACDVTRKFFQDNKIEFEEVKLEENLEEARRIFTEIGTIAVPIIEIKGKTMVGFDEKQVRSCLDF